MCMMQHVPLKYSFTQSRTFVEALLIPFRFIATLKKKSHSYRIISMQKLREIKCIKLCIYIYALNFMETCSCIYSSCCKPNNHIYMIIFLVVQGVMTKDNGWTQGKRTDHKSCWKPMQLSHCKFHVKFQFIPYHLVSAQYILFHTIPQF